MYFHTAIPSCGVLFYHDEASLIQNGFTKCYDQPYSYPTSSADFTSCNRFITFVGAKASSAQTYIDIGAFGLTKNIFAVSTSLTFPTYDPIGAYWYKYTAKSFGFSATSSVNLNNCDYGQVGPDCVHRLCWHLDQAGLGGYRAGCAIGLNSDVNWRKVMYTGNALQSCFPGNAHHRCAVFIFILYSGACFYNTGCDKNPNIGPL